MLVTEWLEGCRLNIRCSKCQGNSQLSVGKHLRTKALFSFLNSIKVWMSQKIPWLNYFLAVISIGYTVSKLIHRIIDAGAVIMSFALTESSYFRQTKTSRSTWQKLQQVYPVSFIIHFGNNKLNNYGRKEYFTLKFLLLYHWKDIKISWTSLDGFKFV